MATNVDDPIVVNGTSSVPNVIGAVLRYAGTALGSFALAKGWLTADSLPQVVGAVVAIGSALYGVILTHFNKKKIVAIAEAAPNSVAVVK